MHRSWNDWYVQPCGWRPAAWPTDKEVQRPGNAPTMVFMCEEPKIIIVNELITKTLQNTKPLRHSIDDYTLPRRARLHVEVRPPKPAHTPCCSPRPTNSLGGTSTPFRGATCAAWTTIRTPQKSPNRNSTSPGNDPIGAEKAGKCLPTPIIIVTRTVVPPPSGHNSNQWREVETPTAILILY